MRIEKGSKVTLAYSMELEGGTVVESVPNDDPFQFVMGRHEVFPAIESSLWGRQEGDAFVFDVAPHEAFGHYDDQLVRPYPREAFDEDPLNSSAEGALKAGERYTAETVVEGVPVTFLVKEIHEDHVLVDFNHHLAGKPLKIRVEVLKVE